MYIIFNNWITILILRLWTIFIKLIKHNNVLLKSKIGLMSRQQHCKISLNQMI